MNSQSQSPTLRTLGLLALFFLAPFAAQAADPEVEQAIQLYEQRRYAEARAALEALDAQGKATGTLLYRLYYAQLAQNIPGNRATLERAKTALERETAESGDLETFFYLSNAYANLGQSGEMLRAARTATARFESGAFAAPENAEGMFRIAKLYADTNSADNAAGWYRKALAAFEDEGQGSGSTNAAYVNWAERYLAQWAFDAQEYDLAERYLTRQLAQNKGNAQEYDRLAMVRARLGLYADAAAAWKRSEEIDPANGDRARYALRIAKHAARLDSLPATTTDGRLWEELTKEDLDALLKEITVEVKDIQARTEAYNAVIRDAQARHEAELGQPEPDSRKERKKRKKRLNTLQQEIDDGWDARYVEITDFRERIAAAEPRFVAAALEYAMRGYSLRESAFFGGYAPLIFRPASWVVPYP